MSRAAFTTTGQTTPPEGGREPPPEDDPNKAFEKTKTNTAAKLPINFVRRDIHRSRVTHDINGQDEETASPLCLHEYPTKPSLTVVVT